MADFIDDMRATQRRWKCAGCTCTGHMHRGGVGGCYFGGILVPRCPCKWNGDLDDVTPTHPARARLTARGARGER